MRLMILIVLVVIAAVPAVAQNLERGEVLFKKCKACHQIGENATNKTGPVLTGVLGRTAGSYEGYKYGKSMRAAGAAGLVWDEEMMFAYIADPKEFLRKYLDDKKAKAKMSFRLKGEQDRRDVIAFVASFNPNQIATSGTVESCVVNASDHGYLFAAEAPDGNRVVSPLEPGERLCAEGGDIGVRAVVSVFEDKPGNHEGCSRLIKGGDTEVLLRFAEADRCKWSSHQD